jgi:hypothetical protein
MRCTIVTNIGGAVKYYGHYDVRLVSVGDIEGAGVVNLCEIADRKHHIS